LVQGESQLDEALAAMFAAAGVTPRSVTPRLAW